MTIAGGNAEAETGGFVFNAVRAMAGTTSAASSTTAVRVARCKAATTRRRSKMRVSEAPFELISV